MLPSLSDAASELDSFCDSLEVDKFPEHELVIREWCNGELHNDISLLREVEYLTGCDLKPRSDKKTIVIRGRSDQDVERAVAKLDMLWASTVSRHGTYSSKC